MSCVYEVVCAYVLLEITVLYNVVCNRPQGYHLVPGEELKQLMYCIKSLCVLLLIRLVVNLQYIATANYVVHMHVLLIMCCAGIGGSQKGPGSLEFRKREEKN